MLSIVQDSKRSNLQLKYLLSPPECNPQTPRPLGAVFTSRKEKSLEERSSKADYALVIIQQEFPLWATNPLSKAPLVSATLFLPLCACANAKRTVWWHTVQLYKGQKPPAGRDRARGAPSSTLTHSSPSITAGIYKAKSPSCNCQGEHSFTPSCYTPGNSLYPAEPEFAVNYNEAQSAHGRCTSIDCYATFSLGHSLTAKTNLPARKFTVREFGSKIWNRLERSSLNLHFPNGAI